MDDDLSGTVLDGRYELLERLGVGSSGAVYRGKQLPIDRVVAVKIVDLSVNDTPGYQERLELEASLSARLASPHITPLFDFGRLEDRFYFVLEYVDGETLAQKIEREAPFDVDDTINIAIQIARALRDANAQSLVHRDLKPSNVLITHQSGNPHFVKLIDFGLVKDVSMGAETITDSGVFMGSPKYVAPEQILGKPVDTRTDLYSLGVVIYEMLSGAPPFKAKNDIDLLTSHVRTAPRRLCEVVPDSEIPEDLEALVLQLLEKKPDKRLQSPIDLIEALQNLTGGRDLLASYSLSLSRERILQEIDSLSPGERGDMSAANVMNIDASVEDEDDDTLIDNGPNPDDNITITTTRTQSKLRQTDDDESNHGS